MSNAKKNPKPTNEELQIALQNLITFAVNLADNVMIGGYSQDALSGVAMVNQIQFLLSGDMAKRELKCCKVTGFQSGLRNVQTVVRDADMTDIALLLHLQCRRKGRALCTRWQCGAH